VGDNYGNVVCDYGDVGNEFEDWEEDGDGEADYISRRACYRCEGAAVVLIEM
jgi:hypothetical protein